MKKKISIVSVLVLSFLFISHLSASADETYAQCQADVTQIQTDAKAKINAIPPVSVFTMEGQYCAPLSMPACANAPINPGSGENSSMLSPSALSNFCVAYSTASVQCKNDIESGKQQEPEQIAYAAQVKAIQDQAKVDVDAKQVQCNTLADAPSTPVTSPQTGLGQSNPNPITGVTQPSNTICPTPANTTLLTSEVSSLTDLKQDLQTSNTSLSNQVSALKGQLITANSEITTLNDQLSKAEASLKVAGSADFQVVTPAPTITPAQEVVVTPTTPTVTTPAPQTDTNVIHRFRNWITTIF